MQRLNLEGSFQQELIKFSNILFFLEILHIFFVSLFLILGISHLSYRNGLFLFFLEIAVIAARAGSFIYEMMVSLALLFKWLFAVLTPATEDFVSFVIHCFPSFR